MQEKNAYQKIVDTLKKRKKGATAADVCAATALPLSAVRELLPKAADEFSGHLQVTQSGEIVYYFPRGFTSRYRGFGAVVKRIADKSAVVVKAVLVFLFKVWIMVTLIGYFVLFLALALASVFISISAKSSGNRNRRGGSSGFNMFSLLWRIWFYSELTRPNYQRGSVARNKEPGRPMHKAVFSFVFGEDDPNKDWEEKENKAIIAYIQANRGVVSLAEYMAFSGKNSMEAEEAILAFCAKFSGSPEVTEEGTIVYRFDELLLRSSSANMAELIPPVKRLKIFSANTKTMNGWFIVINAVNLIFGSYFLFQTFSTEQASYLYAFTHSLFSYVVENPANFIWTTLGITPFLFSLFFWLIPVVRFFLEKKENDGLKLENFKRLGFSKIWSSPSKILTSSFRPQADECRPRDIAAAEDRVIKDIGAISNPEVELSEDGKTIYAFSELEKEKRALAKYRASLDIAQTQLGKTVFDSGE